MHKVIEGNGPYLVPPHFVRMNHCGCNPVFVLQADDMMVLTLVMYGVVDKNNVTASALPKRGVHEKRANSKSRLSGHRHGA